MRHLAHVPVPELAMDLVRPVDGLRVLV